ncbi:hypothetical protein MMC25_000601 [Agyrium rufum]|nr:hypothetical protein [Agyrium rufum]
MASKPLVTHIYTADPSAHVFDGKLYVYPSHDRETDIQFNDNGDQYDMADYHIISLDKVGGEATDHGVALSVEDVPWVSKQLWAPDCAKSPKDGKYYLYFPARDKDTIFRIGVAVSDSPTGPFKAEPEPIAGSFSIDPASFVDADGKVYLYFGGLWGGQLQCYSSPEGGKFDASKGGPQEPSGEGVVALCPRVGHMKPNMKEFASPPQDVQILDPATGKPILADDHERRFFEAAWMHKKGETYYFSYSTGDTHLISYATGSSPLGPFTYGGTLLEPVVGWTTHHSIVEWDGRWWLFYHDCELSKGVDHLRSVRMREIKYNADGKMVLVEKQ